ncbi:TPA: hypothetical protein JG871_003959 [Enterobacter hormaechei subsp. xiangfangensis]|nr:hypothetical protein [Enterobacter hormaechei subsp. xiangfangensis]
MHKNLQLFKEQQSDVLRRAEAVRGLLLEDIPLFEGVKGSDTINHVWKRALVNFERKFGKLPSDNLLAAAHAAVERVIDKKARKGFNHNAALFEAVESNMSDSKGVLNNPVWSAILLPTLLNATTSSLCTFIDAKREVVDILQMLPVAAKDVGDYKAGDILDGTQVGQFGSMLRFGTLPAAEQPDGTLDTFSFSTSGILGTAQPILPGTIQLVIDGQPIPIDFDKSRYERVISITLQGTYSTALLGAVVNIDYPAGAVIFDFSKAINGVPKKGTVLGLEFSLDEEENPDLIPEINGRAFMRQVRTSRYMLSAQSSIMAQYDFQREMGMQLSDTLQDAIANWLAAELDARRLRAALFYNTHAFGIDITAQTNEDFEARIARLKAALAVESDSMIERNKNIGITGAYCGEKAAQFLRSLPAAEFEPDPVTITSPGIRRIGVLFGVIECFEVPEAACTAFTSAGAQLASDEMLCFGSDGNGHSPLVAGDGVPASVIDHGTTNKLQQRRTVYGTEVTALNPFGGTHYMILLQLKGI